MEKFTVWSSESGTYAENFGETKSGLAFALPENIVIIADLGLWDGRVSAYKELNSNILSDCLEIGECDDYEWTVDENDEFTCTARHHDGTNYYRYRIWKPRLSDRQKKKFLDLVYQGRAGEEEINKFTVKTGGFVRNLYIQEE